MDDQLYNYLTPNIGFDPTVALAGTQSQQFNAGLDQQQGSNSQQAFQIEYQIPYAIRYASPIAVASSSFANSVGVPDVVGSGTGTGNSSNIIVGPPGPPGPTSLIVADSLTTVTGVGEVDFVGATVTDGGGGVAIVTVTGGGSSPGGANTDVQFNDSGSFGGVSSFTFNKNTNTLGLDSGSGQGSGDIITGGVSDLNIRTENKTGAGSAVGDLRIKTGSNTGSSYAQAGTIFINAGNGVGTGGDHNSIGGGVRIVTGNSRGTNQPGGTFSVQTGLGTTSSTYSTYGLITLNNGSSANHNYNGIISVSTNLVLSNTADLNNPFPDAPTVNGTGGNAMFVISNATNVPTTPITGAGILYVDNGALKYMGDTGTVTTIASA